MYFTQVNILKTESCSSDIDLKFRDKLECFGKMSNSLMDKLQSLLYLSENYSSVNNDLKQFVNGIVNLWISVNKQVKLLHILLLLIMSVV